MYTHTAAPFQRIDARRTPSGPATASAPCAGTPAWRRTRERAPRCGEGAFIKARRGAAGGTQELRYTGTQTNNMPRQQYAAHIRGGGGAGGCRRCASKHSGTTSQAPHKHTTNKAGQPQRAPHITCNTSQQLHIGEHSPRGHAWKRHGGLHDTSLGTAVQRPTNETLGAPEHSSCRDATAGAAPRPT